jgi:hypothetical protein
MGIWGKINENQGSCGDIKQVQKISEGQFLGAKKGLFLYLRAMLVLQGPTL